VLRDFKFSDWYIIVLIKNVVIMYIIMYIIMYTLGSETLSSFCYVDFSESKIFFYDDSNLYIYKAES